MAMRVSPLKHTELGAAGEAYVARLLSSVGLRVQFEGPADLMVEGNAIEVKAARFRPYRSGGDQGFQFCLHRRGRNGGLVSAIAFLLLGEVLHILEKRGRR